MYYDLRNILKHTSIYSIGKVASKAIGFFLIPLYTNYLSPEDYGILELLTVMVILSGIIIQGGISTAIFKFFNTYDNEQDKNQVISTIMWFLTIVCLIFCATGGLIPSELSLLLFKTEQYSYLVVLMLISFFFSTIASVPESFIMARKQSKKFTIISLVTLAVNLTLNIYFVVYDKAGIEGILYASIISRVINTAYLLIDTVPSTGVRFDSEKLKEILRFSIPLIPTEFGLFLFAFSDRFFLSHLSNLENVGLYSLGYKFAFMLSLVIVQPFMQIWQQEMYEISKNEKAADIFGRMYSYLFGVVTGSALIISIFIKDIIELISGPEFHEAWKTVPILCFAYVFRATYLYFQMGMLFDSKTKRLSYVTLAGSLFTIIFNIILVPRYGAIGTATATLGSYAVLAVITYLASQRLFRINFEFGCLLKIIAMAITIWLIYWRLSFESHLISIIVRFTSIPILIGSVWFFGVVTPIEKCKIKQFVFRTPDSESTC